MVRVISVHTGNILQLPDLKRKPGHTPADELYDTLKIQIPKFHPSKEEDFIKITFPEEISPKLKPEDRSTQKITVKLFLSSPAATNSVIEALDKALEELGAKQADLFLLSWPANIDTEAGELLWREMERTVDEGKALSLGVSDIETNPFIQLHEEARIKPEAIQINLESCCVVPPELALFARENNTQLLTHNDPRNILSDEEFQTICSASTMMTVNWTVRYQTLLRCRGIIQNKGYIISAQQVLDLEH